VKPSNATFRLPTNASRCHTNGLETSLVRQNSLKVSQTQEELTAGREANAKRFSLPAECPCAVAPRLLKARRFWGANFGVILTRLLRWVKSLVLKRDSRDIVAG
jgi:hypothetical protein